MNDKPTKKDMDIVLNKITSKWDKKLINIFQ